MIRAFRTSHLPLVILLSFFFGTSLVVSRFALTQLHPLVYAAVRMPVAAGLVVIWTMLRYRRFPRGRKLWVHGAVVGIFATAAPMMFFISSLQFQSSGVTALFISLTPIVAMIYSHFLLSDDRMNARKAVGAAISFAGVGLLLATGETGLAEARWEGFVLVMIGVAANGFGTVHVRKYLSDENGLDITTVRLLVATIIVVPVAWIVAGYDFSGLQWSGVVALIYGAIPGTLLGFLLYSTAAARFGPSKATQTEYLVPVVAVVAGVIFLDERLTVIVVAGMVLALLGIFVATRRPRGSGAGAQGI